MDAWWPAALLLLMVGVLLFLCRQPFLSPLFQWLPVPLWCYLLPALGVHLGWLPRETEAALIYRPLIHGLLPVALLLLLLGADLPSVLRTGRRALIAAAAGAVGVLAGVACGVWLMQDQLPAHAWKGAGALVGTWTGGTMNLLALRTLLEIPEAIFAPLILVDAMVAYSWMMLLMAVSGSQRSLNRWLRATETHATVPVTNRVEGPLSKGARSTPRRASALLCCLAVALVVTCSARWIAGRLPTTPWINSAAGWTVWLVTTAALSLSLLPSVRRLGAQGTLLGYPCLYLVLAATGAQASLQALQATPAWVAVGLVVVAMHAGLLLMIGRWCRLPLGILATASQANIGGVVSAPIVGAVYHPSLAPLGVVLAIAGNALGTYLGVVGAQVCRFLTRSS